MILNVCYRRDLHRMRRTNHKQSSELHQQILEEWPFKLLLIHFKYGKMIFETFLATNIDNVETRRNIYCVSCFYTTLKVTCNLDAFYVCCLFLFFVLLRLYFLSQQSWPDFPEMRFPFLVFLWQTFSWPLTPPPAAIIICSSITSAQFCCDSTWHSSSSWNERRKTTHNYNNNADWWECEDHSSQRGTCCQRVYPGVNFNVVVSGVGGGGGIQYIGSGIFYPGGVSICAPSAGSDITCCNSAGGIIDLSTGSRHQHHHSAMAAERGRRPASTQLCLCWLIHPVRSSDV